MFKVKNLTLLIIAAAVWFAAGANIAHIGLEEYALGYVSVLNIALSIVVGVVVHGVPQADRQAHQAHRRLR